MSSDLLHVLVGMFIATTLIHSVVFAAIPTSAQRVLFINATWPVWVVSSLYVSLRLLCKFVLQRKNKEE